MTDRDSDIDASLAPEPRSLPSLHWERAIRAEIRQSLAEHRQDDALALAESLLRGAYPRQLDVFRLYGELCQRTGRFERGFQVLWKAAELIEQVSPWYGIQAWLALGELAPTDLRPLRRASQAGRGRHAGLGLLAQRGLRAAYGRLVESGLEAEAASLQGEVDFPLAGEPPAQPLPPLAPGPDLPDEIDGELAEAALFFKYGLVEQGRRAVERLEQRIAGSSDLDDQARAVLAARVAEHSELLARGAVPPVPVADTRFRDAAQPATWRDISQELEAAGELAGAAYAAARAALLESQPGRLAGPEVDGGATGMGARVLVFPAGRVGVVQVRPWLSDEPWTEGSPARGHVVVPARHEARLRLDEDEPRMVEVLERLGPGDVQDLDLCDQRVDDGVLARLRRFAGLRRLSIAGADLACSGVLADPTLIVGARLGEIHHQTLGFGPTDDGLRHLAALRELRELDISVSGLGDRGLATLGLLEHLEVLHLDGTRLTDRGLDAVASFSRLRALDLSRTQVGPEGLAALARLPALEFLSVAGIDLSDAPDGLFGGFPALRVLQASRTGLPIPALWGCARLERLDLSGHGLATEDTLVALADLPSLRTLLLAAMRGDVGPAIAALRAAGGAHIQVIRDREDGFMGVAGTFHAQPPEE